MEKLVFIVGPTGVGKSAVAIELAKYIGGEIISADSMQVYKGIDVLSQKVNKLQRDEIAHHLIDISEPTDEFNAAIFSEHALEAIRKIIKINKIPIVCGGTGLYVKALIDGLFDTPAPDLILRSKLYAQAIAQGKEKLFDRLKEIDPNTAAAIDKHNLRRLVRAIEIYETSGVPMSKLKPRTKGIADEFDMKMFGLSMDRERLYERIDARVDKMFEEGAVEEAKRLLALNLSQTAKATIGLNEIERFLNGQFSFYEAKNLIKQKTRNYAKRQMTWFRKDKRIEWIDVNEKTAKQAALEIASSADVSSASSQ